MPLHDFRSIYLPYCLKKQDNGKYAVLNREYKPVGFNTNDYIRYENFPVMTAFKITKAKAKKLSAKGEDCVDTIYLYNDGCVPTHSKKNMDAYLKKVAILASLITAD